MSHLYTIMPLDTEHVDEICEDIRWQYENGVADCALFMIKLVPEGDPVIDKAAIECEKYARFREKLESMGFSCGVLVQCTTPEVPQAELPTEQDLLAEAEAVLSCLILP